MALVTKTLRAAVLQCRPMRANITGKRCLSCTFGDDNNSCCCGGCCNGPCPNMYDSRKYGHCWPGNKTQPCFMPLPQIPTDVFRCTCGESLGPQGQASKCGMYLNPEYFSFHHMTYYDMHVALRNYRRSCPKTGRKP